MDYSNRNQQAAPPAAPAGQGGHRGHASKYSGGGRKDMWSKVGIVLCLAAVLILLVGLFALVFSNNKTIKSESKYIISDKLQAVFLNTGQVYFGHIGTLNSQYLTLSDIYYLQTASNGSSSSTTAANSNVTLVKLGCELHQPYDQMVINRTQVTFWENLQESGQVAKAVSKFQQQNPNGQKCADQSTSSSNTTNATQNSSQNSGSTKSTSTTPAKP